MSLYTLPLYFNRKKESEKRNPTTSYFRFDYDYVFKLYLKMSV